jgi:hypothetical protein
MVRKSWNWKLVVRLVTPAGRRLKSEVSSGVRYNDSCMQPDRTVAFCAFGRGERKVRTPQSSVPDNVRDAGFKPGGRKVPQKIYRPVRP